MVPERSDLIDLLDLKMLPAWVQQPAATDYALSGEDDDRAPRRERRSRVPGSSRMRKAGQHRNGRGRPVQDRHHAAQEREGRSKAQSAPPQVTVRFSPQARALENVVVQISA